MLAHIFFGLVIKEGDLSVTDCSGKTRNFGNGTGKKSAIRLHDRRAEWTLFLRPKLAVGEAYTDGRLTVEQGDLLNFLRVCIQNMKNLERHPFWATLHAIQYMFRHIYSWNPSHRARRNVAHHYDLSDELYSLFLDSDRQYSCAYFRHPGDSLEKAQEDKKRHLAAKLVLDRPGLRTLDIGSGWGGMALYLAQTAGARVTGLTLSTEQHRISNHRARESNLSDQVNFELQDYRHNTGHYDRIVSVGMFEHVGSGHYREFFRKVRELLADDGIMVLHSIGRCAPPGTTNAWVRKYIFPGGYTPALSEIMSAVEKEGLFVTDIEVLRIHYAETLYHWRKRFYANRDKVRDLYDERFCRMWDFYLTGCESAFRYWDQVVFQIQLSKELVSPVPIQRDYIGAWESDTHDRREAAAE